jgi:DNA/RNA endonuclease YhcR with UshA esterase domain
MKHLFLISFFVGAFFLSGSAQTPIADAGKHLNEKVSIIDKVYDIRTSQTDGGLVLSLGAKYPNQLLTVILPAAARSKFATHPEDAYKGRIVYVSGIVTSYEGKPTITVADSTQLKVAYTDPMAPPQN